MKRLLLTVCCTILISINSKAQLDTIPNAGFENWYYTAIWTIEATGWQTNNSSIAAWNVTPDSIPHSGILSLKLEKVSYRGSIWSGFPLSQHPVALEGYVKNGLGVGDTALIYIHLYLSNILVDSGYGEIYGGIGSGFLPFYVSISQNISSADSCVITLTGGNQFGSIIWFDDLVFAFPTSIQEQEGNGWNIFPNPCTDSFTLTGVSAGENPAATLHDITGRIILEEKLSEWQNKRVINMRPFPAGTYVLNITNGEKRIRYIMIKN